ncbi:MAG: hypothetical protein RLZZ488_1235 [Pseudomonadota bacterium]|jgi:SET domain-containing protein
MMRMDLTRDRGRGMFATMDIAEGTVIEDAPVIVVPADQLAAIKSTVLFEYFFQWKTDGREGCAICLGFGSIYNHSSTSANARYVRLYAENKIRFIAIRNIRAGEEILTNYNGDAEYRHPLWFEENRSAIAS